MKCKVIYLLLYLILEAVQYNALMQIKNSLEPKGNNSVLLKILQSVDAATNDEHLFDVTLKLLRSLCYCMRETLKIKDGRVKFDGNTNSIQSEDDIKSSNTKALDLYKKIYNKTCFNLQKELNKKVVTIYNNSNDDNFSFNKSDCSHRIDITTENVIRASAVTVPILKDDVKTKLENVLFKILIQTKDYHDYKLRRYNLFGNIQSVAKNLDKHSIIVILTLYPNDTKNSSLNQDSAEISEYELNRTLSSNTKVEIDIIDTKYSSEKETSEKNNKSELVSECRLKSVYTFLIDSEKKNLTKVFKLLRKKGTIKIYVDVTTGRHHSDYSSICCKNETNSMPCRTDFIKHNSVETESVEYNKKNDKEKAKFNIMNFHNTVPQLQHFVKMYEYKLKENDKNLIGITKDEITTRKNVGCKGVKVNTNINSDQSINFNKSELFNLSDYNKMKNNFNAFNIKNCTTTEKVANLEIKANIHNEKYFLKKSLLKITSEKADSLQSKARSDVTDVINATDTITTNEKINTENNVTNKTLLEISTISDILRLADIKKSNNQNNKFNITLPTTLIHDISRTITKQIKFPNEIQDDIRNTSPTSDQITKTITTVSNKSKIYSSIKGNEIINNKMLNNEPRISSDDDIFTTKTLKDFKTKSLYVIPANVSVMSDIVATKESNKANFQNKRPNRVEIAIPQDFDIKITKQEIENVNQLRELMSKTFYSTDLTLLPDIYETDSFDKSTKRIKKRLNGKTYVFNNPEGSNQGFIELNRNISINNDTEKEQTSDIPSLTTQSYINLNHYSLNVSPKSALITSKPYVTTVEPTGLTTNKFNVTTILTTVTQAEPNVHNAIPTELNVLSISIKPKLKNNNSNPNVVFNDNLVNGNVSLHTIDKYKEDPTSKLSIPHETLTDKMSRLTIGFIKNIQKNKYSNTTILNNSLSSNQLRLRKNTGDMPTEDVKYGTAFVDDNHMTPNYGLKTLSEYHIAINESSPTDYINKIMPFVFNVRTTPNIIKVTKTSKINVNSTIEKETTITDTSLLKNTSQKMSLTYKDTEYNPMMSVVSQGYIKGDMKPANDQYKMNTENMSLTLIKEYDIKTKDRAMYFATGLNHNNNFSSSKTAVITKILRNSIPELFANISEKKSNEIKFQTKNITYEYDNNNTIAEKQKRLSVIDINPMSHSLEEVTVPYRINKNLDMEHFLTTSQLSTYFNSSTTSRDYMNGDITTDYGNNVLHNNIFTDSTFTITNVTSISKLDKIRKYTKMYTDEPLKLKNINKEAKFNSQTTNYDQVNGLTLKSNKLVDRSSNDYRYKDVVASSTSRLHDVQVTAYELITNINKSTNNLLIKNSHLHNIYGSEFCSNSSILSSKHNVTTSRDKLLMMKIIGTENPLISLITSDALLNNSQNDTSETLDELLKFKRKGNTTIDVEKYANIDKSTKNYANMSYLFLKLNNFNHTRRTITNVSTATTNLYFSSLKETDKPYNLRRALYLPKISETQIQEPITTTNEVKQKTSDNHKNIKNLMLTTSILSQKYDTHIFTKTTNMNPLKSFADIVYESKYHNIKHISTQAPTFNYEPFLNTVKERDEATEKISAYQSNVKRYISKNDLIQSINNNEIFSTVLLDIKGNNDLTKTLKIENEISSKFLEMTTEPIKLIIQSVDDTILQHKNDITYKQNNEIALKENTMRSEILIDKKFDSNAKKESNTKISKDETEDLKNNQRNTKAIQVMETRTYASLDIDLVKPYGLKNTSKTKDTISTESKKNAHLILMRPDYEYFQESRTVNNNRNTSSRAEYTESMYTDKWTKILNGSSQFYNTNVTNSNDTIPAAENNIIYDCNKKQNDSLKNKLHLKVINILKTSISLIPNTKTYHSLNVNRNENKTTNAITLKEELELTNKTIDTERMAETKLLIVEDFKINKTSNKTLDKSKLKENANTEVANDFLSVPSKTSDNELCDGGNKISIQENGCMDCKQTLLFNNYEIRKRPQRKKMNTNKMVQNSGTTNETDELFTDTQNYTKMWKTCTNMTTERIIVTNSTNAHEKIIAVEKMDNDSMLQNHQYNGTKIFINHTINTSKISHSGKKEDTSSINNNVSIENPVTVQTFPWSDNHTKRTAITKEAIQLHADTTEKKEITKFQFSESLPLQEMTLEIPEKLITHNNSSSAVTESTLASNSVETAATYSILVDQESAKRQFTADIVKENYKHMTKSNQQAFQTEKEIIFEGFISQDTNRNMTDFEYVNKIKYYELQTEKLEPMRQIEDVFLRQHSIRNISVNNYNDTEIISTKLKSESIINKLKNNGVTTTTSLTPTEILQQMSANMFQTFIENSEYYNIKSSTTLEVNPTNVNFRIVLDNSKKHYKISKTERLHKSIGEIDKLYHKINDTIDESKYTTTSFTNTYVSNSKDIPKNKSLINLKQENVIKITRRNATNTKKLDTPEHLSVTSKGYARTKVTKSVKNKTVGKYEKLKKHKRNRHYSYTNVNHNKNHSFTLKTFKPLTTTFITSTKNVIYNTYEPTVEEDLDYTVKEKILQTRNDIDETTKYNIAVTRSKTYKNIQMNNTKNLSKPVTVERFNKKVKDIKELLKSVNNSKSYKSIRSNFKTRYIRNNTKNQNIVSGFVTRNFSNKQSKVTLLNPLEKSEKEFKKTNLYPVLVPPPKSQRKIMKKIQLANKRKEIITMNTRDFLSHRGFVTQRNLIRELSIMYPKRIFHKSMTTAPKQYLLRPMFDKIDRPKISAVFDSNINNDEDFYRDLPFNHRTGLSWRDKINFMQDTVRRQAITHKPNVNTVLDRPVMVPGTNPRLLRDKVNSIRNYIYNVELEKPTTQLPFFRKAYFLKPPFDLSDDGKYDDPPVYYYRRTENDIHGPTTNKISTKRRRRTMFFLSPTVPYNRYF